MKKVLLLIAVAAFAMPAMAELTGTATKMPGTYTQLNDNSVALVQDGTASVPHARASSICVYDNMPTFWGGTATPGAAMPYAGNPTWIGYRWNSTQAAWGDDLHMENFPSENVCHITYGALLQATGTVNHTIRLYTYGVSPSYCYPESTVVVTKGTPLTAFTVHWTITATGWYQLGIDIPAGTVHLPNNGAWISFRDPANTTFWLTGGNPGIGSSCEGVLYDYMGSVAAYWVPGPFYFTSLGMPYGTAHGNVACDIWVPEPGTIGLMALAGLAALYRRR
jgi:hypothetical protein